MWVLKSGRNGGKDVTVGNVGSGTRPTRLCQLPSGQSSTPPVPAIERENDALCLLYLHPVGTKASHSYKGDPHTRERERERERKGGRVTISVQQGSNNPEPRASRSMRWPHRPPVSLSLACQAMCLFVATDCNVPCGSNR